MSWKIKQFNNTDKYFLKFYILAIFIISISILFPFLVNYFFSSWEKSAQFSDTYGALNSLFSGLAFSGIVVTILIQKKELENQKIELQLQRGEMRSARKEFLINRITNLVYSQLGRFEKALLELEITHNQVTYLGNDAILFLDGRRDLNYFRIDRPELSVNDRKAKIIEQLKIYTQNKSSIEKFAHSAYNSVEVMKRLIFMTDLGIDDLNELKKLYFVNIGFVNMGVIETISDVFEGQIDLLKAEDYINNNFNSLSLSSACFFLKSIKQFYQLQLTTENFEKCKIEWTQG